MKKLIFSLAGVALVAGSALAFTTAQVRDTTPACETLDPGHRCTVPIPNEIGACCVQDGQYFKLEDN